MNWFFIALIGPILWAFVNHIDKYTISKYFTGRGVGSLVVFTGLSGLIISFFIFIFGYSQIFINPISACVIAINGAILVASFIPYLHALEKEEATWASSLYQLIPVFAYALGSVFLHEKLTDTQILASLLVISGAILISLDLSQKIKFKKQPFLLMILSAFMLAVNALIFKIIALNEAYWGTAFWEYIGGGLFCFVLLGFVPLYREQFIATIKKSKTAVITINFTSELLNIIAKLAANFASLFAPLALIWVVNGLQPMMVFVYGLIFTAFFPKFAKEDQSKKVLIQKICAMMVMFLGLYLLIK